MTDGRYLPVRVSRSGCFWTLWDRHGKRWHKDGTDGVQSIDDAARFDSIEAAENKAKELESCN